MKSHKPISILVYWHKDATKVSLYAGGKRLAVIKNHSAERLEDFIGPFLEGWFGTDNRADWRYRVRYA